MCPKFSPDGKKLLLVLSKDKTGATEVYLLDLLTRKETRLTRHRSIDTEPSWYPNGEDIVIYYQKTHEQ